MMGKHGIMVLSPLFCLDAIELLEPKGHLCQVIVFHAAFHDNVRIIDPKLRSVEPMGTLVHDILQRKG